MKRIVTMMSAAVLFAAPAVYARQDAAKEVSGAYYDWTKTLKPEQPWLHDYSQTLVMKMFLSSTDTQGRVDKVYLKFDDALEVIKKLDHLTLGIPKIVYLVGWQFTGHDSGYPAWDVVNDSLKRSHDQTGLQSLRWLMKEAKQFNTTVSLHLNMLDAYENSPLWKTYYDNHVILKDEDGNPIKGEVHGGTLQSYQISYAREWQLGFAQKRIDGLLKMLPELKEGGTIHIDAFHSMQPVRPDDPLSNPYVRLTVNDEIAAQRKIFRYWRMKGLDVTTEGGMYRLRWDPFIGLQPMAWHFELGNFLRENWLKKPADFNYETLPATLYTGTPMQAEQEIMKDPVHLTGIAQQFCTKVVPWYYRNYLGPKREGAVITEPGPQEWRNVFLPALWLKSTLVACSERGYESKALPLPPSWRQVRKVSVSHITIDGLKHVTTVLVRNGTVTLTLKPSEVVALTAN